MYPQPLRYKHICDSQHLFSLLSACMSCLTHLLSVCLALPPGDLFDFDLEVEPILEVLVSKVLEQGLMEVLEEEELSVMRAHQQHFEQIRSAELVAAQRLEAAERRKMEEKERRLKQVGL